MTIRPAVVEAAADTSDPFGATRRAPMSYVPLTHTQGCVYCWVRDVFNAGASAFYERHGFEAVAFSDGSTNEERCPDVLYVLP